MIPKNWLEEAAGRISPYIHHTPISFDSENNIYLKWENHQVTGSFKARGALNKVLALQDWERQPGLVAASAGNHGQGVALAGRLCRVNVIIFISEHAVPSKLEAIRNLGADTRLVTGGYSEAELAGIEFAKANKAVWISPYNDGQVIAGQGTLGLELYRDLPDNLQASWLVPAGGGGLVAGIGASLEYQFKRPKLIAIQSSASSFLHALYHQGSQDGIIEMPSLADGLAGPVEHGSITIPLVRKYVDDFLLVTEDEISHAISYAWHKYQEQIEGSAAVVLAAVLSNRVKQRPAVLVISGGNIQPEIFKRIVDRG